MIASSKLLPNVKQKQVCLTLDKNNALFPGKNLITFTRKVLKCYTLGRRDVK